MDISPDSTSPSRSVSSSDQSPTAEATTAAHPRSDYVQSYEVPSETAALPSSDPFSPGVEGPTAPPPSTSPVAHRTSITQSPRGTRHQHPQETAQAESSRAAATHINDRAQEQSRPLNIGQVQALLGNLNTDSGAAGMPTPESAELTPASDKTAHGSERLQGPSATGTAAQERPSPRAEGVNVFDNRRHDVSGEPAQPRVIEGIDPEHDWNAARLPVTRPPGTQVSSTQQTLSSPPNSSVHHPYLSAQAAEARRLNPGRGPDDRLAESGLSSIQPMQDMPQHDQDSEVRDPDGSSPPGKEEGVSPITQSQQHSTDKGKGTQRQQN